MAIESMVMGDAGVTALAMVGLSRWSMVGKPIIYSYVGPRIVVYFQTRRTNRLTHKAVKRHSFSGLFHSYFVCFVLRLHLAEFSKQSTRRRQN